MAPRFIRPDGRTDLVRTADHLATYMLTHCRGIANIIGARRIARLYGINIAQARDCAQRARKQLEQGPHTLCGKPGPDGGWWIAATEEEARSHMARRNATDLTRGRNSARSARASRRGVVRGTPPAVQQAWAKTEKALGTVRRDLRRVRRELPKP